MSLPFQNQDFPAVSGKEITPSDTDDIQARSLYVGSGGDVAVEWQDGNTTVLKGVSGGSVLPVNVKKVLSTNTTATDIVALV